MEGEHKHLNDWADKHLQEQRSSFKKDMVDFEVRAKRDGLSQEELLKTYQQIDRMTAAQGEKPISSLERQRLVVVMHNVPLYPHPFPRATTRHARRFAEARTYTRTPADAAAAVDVALTGEYSAGRHDGKDKPHRRRYQKCGRQKMVCAPTPAKSFR